MTERDGDPFEGGPLELISVGLARPQGERRPHPVDQSAEIHTVSWVLEGEALLALTGNGGAWLSFEDETEDAWPCVRSFPGGTSVMLAPDRRHAAVLTATLLARITECDDMGVVGSCSLVHVRPGQATETLATHAEVNPRLSSMSPDGRFAVIEVDGRWQLHQLASEGGSVIVLDENFDADARPRIRPILRYQRRISSDTEPAASISSDSVTCHRHGPNGSNTGSLLAEIDLSPNSSAEPEP